MIIRLATPGDVPQIVQWRHAAAQWLASIGSDQWSDIGLNDRDFEKRVRESIAAGETWMAEVAGQPVGTIAIDEWTDVGLWTAEEQANALFLHRMIIDRGSAGQGVGAVLLDHAAEVARDHGKNWLRLDAWTTNSGLHQYYRDQGFTHVRTVTDHPSPSTALFQRPVHGSEVSTSKRQTT